MTGVKLGLNLGYWGMGNDADNLALAREADVLGYSCAWAAEAYGSDAPTVLAWVGAQTERIGLGSSILQIPARSPAMAAMTAATLDTLSGGRFRLGLGVSGPQVSEGWHGVRFAEPLARTREYVDIVNLALSRKRVRYEGRHYTLPLPDGPGKALQLTVHPVREHIPIYLASVGPKNLELTGEIADGWLAIFFSTDFAAEQLALIAAGRAKVGKDLDGFDVVASAPLLVGGLRRRREPGRAGRADPGLRRPLHRRHGQPGGQLLQPARGPDGLPGRGRGDPGAGTWPGTTRPPPRRCRSSSSTRTSLLGPPERIARRMADSPPPGSPR